MFRKVDPSRPEGTGSSPSSQARPGANLLFTGGRCSSFPHPASGLTFHRNADRKSEQQTPGLTGRSYPDRTGAKAKRLDPGRTETIPGNTELMDHIDGFLRNAVEGRDGFRTRIERLLLDDEIRELSRDVDVRALQSLTFYGAAPARGSRTHARLA
jgi:hypothetical protein